MTTLAPAQPLVHKELTHEQVISKAGGVTAEDLAVINGGRFARRDLAPEEVFVGTALVCNDRLDRHKERITRPLLDKFARQLPGVPLYLDHNRTGRARGKFFSGWTEADESGVSWCAGKFYVPRRPHHADLIADLEDGLCSGVSVSFRAKRLAAKSAGQVSGAVAEYTDDEAGNAEIVEVSLVGLPAQVGARVKAADDAADDADALNFLGLTLKSAGGVSEDERQALRAFEKELRLKRAICDELEVETVVEAERLKVLALGGLAERKDLEDEVVKFASILGTVKGALELREYRKMLQGADRATLIAQREGLRRKIPKTDLLDSTASGDGKKDAGPGKERPVLASAFSV